jgi:outer membrane protein assembly factor BamA
VRRNPFPGGVAFLALALFLPLPARAADYDPNANPFGPLPEGGLPVPRAEDMPPLLSRASEDSASAPSFAELEAAGAVIGKVLIKPHDIFDLDDPKENNALFRLANRLHVTTRPSVIERDLLFKPGDRVSVRVIEETERLLRTNRYLHEVQIRPVNYRDGVVDIEVVTRDTWSLDPGLSASRAGGANSGRLSLREYNLLGSGISAGVSYSSNVDRAGTEVGFSDNHLFGNRTGIAYTYGVLDVGKVQTFSFGRPFYALDTPWAYGIGASQTDALSTVYNKGNIASQYRSKVDTAEVYGGWSAGRVEGWAQRYSVGVNTTSSTYMLQPDQPPPDFLPADLVLTGPFVRYQIVEDVFERVRNRDSIGKTEFFPLGLQATVQLGRASASMGSTQDSWLYSANISKGLRLPAPNTLFLSASASGRINEGHRENQLLSGTFRYFVPQSQRAQLLLSGAVDVYRQPDTPAPLQLGGDTGLRGYPLSYQSGERRALFTMEERLYSDWYPWRLFRLGGAVFTDFGRAWNGPNEAPGNNKILADAGFGLRFLSARSAFGNVAHIDLAFPLNNRSDVRSVQFLITTKTSF